MMLDKPSSILFARSEIALRSAMAECILKNFYCGNIYVDFVGVRAGCIDSFAVEVLYEIGIDLSRHRPKSFDNLDDEFYVLIITLLPEAQYWAVELTRTMAVEIKFWKTFDPGIVEGDRYSPLTVYRQVRNQLISRIKRSFPLSPPIDT
tara:strand:+ start:6167 stop:6613 length:447 start_codon:yes stop_codon:yes gene_type:complete